MESRVKMQYHIARCATGDYIGPTVACMRKLKKRGNVAEKATANAPGFGFSLTGFSVMCAWHFLMIFTAVFNLSPWVNEGRHIWMQLAIYFGLGLSYMLIARFSRQIVKRFFKSGTVVWRATNIAIAVLAVLASLFVIFSYETPLAWQVFVYLFLAFSGSLLIFPWLQLPQVKDDKSVSYRNLAFNMGIGAAIAIIISFLQSPIVYIGVCLLPFISNVLLILRWDGTDELDESSSGELDTYHRLPMREMIAANMHFLVFGMAFGFCQGAFAQGMSISFVLNDGIPLAGAVLSSLVILFAPYKYLKSYGIFTLQRASMLLFFAGLFLAVFFSESGASIGPIYAEAGYKSAQILTFAGFNIFEFGFMIFSFAWAAKLKSDFAKYIGYNRSILYLGMGFGLALGFCFYMLAGQAPGFLVLAIGAAVVLLTITTLPFFDEFAPYSKIETAEEMRMLDAEAETEAHADEAENGAINDDEEQVDSPDEEDGTPRNTPWRDRVSKIADEHDLSERERDVFFYLAKGRNAAYIQQELWISIHTVKTHIANIYRKLGVHSIQEVLDMVDNAPQPETQEDLLSGKEQKAKGEHSS